MVNTNLVFYFSVSKNCLENRAIKLHIKCLKKYCHIFNTAYFILDCDDINDKETIDEVIKVLGTIGYQDFKIKITEKDGYYEAGAFYREIALKLDKYQGITFFGHTKGITNYEKYDNRNIDAWIFALWYLNIMQLDIIKYEFIERCNVRIWGELYTKNNGNDLKLFKKDGTFYAGTFFWMNTMEIYNDNKKGKITIPTLTNRWYAERFPNDCYDDTELGRAGYTYGDKIYDSTGRYYYDALNIIKWWINNDDINNNFLEELNNITNEL